MPPVGDCRSCPLFCSLPFVALITPEFVSAPLLLTFPPTVSRHRFVTELPPLPVSAPSIVKVPALVTAPLLSKLPWTTTVPPLLATVPLLRLTAPLTVVVPVFTRLAPPEIDTPLPTVSVAPVVEPGRPVGVQTLREVRRSLVLQQERSGYRNARERDGPAVEDRIRRRC